MSEYLLEVAKWGEETSVARGAAIQTAEMVEDDLKTRHRSTFFCLLLSILHFSAVEATEK